MPIQTKVQTPRRKKMPMSGVAISVHTGKVGNTDRDNSPRHQKTMYLFHDPRNILQMLQHIVAEDAFELGVTEGIREMIQITDDVNSQSEAVSVAAER